MNIDFVKSYIKILIEEGYQEADKLKNAKIPNTLYKYFPCSENRISALDRQELWLAQYETFNDPNEFKFMFIDENKFNGSIKYKEAIKFFEAMKKIVSISCFTTNPHNDYFWNEYANNRNGFCIEYIIEKKIIFIRLYIVMKKLK